MMFLFRNTANCWEAFGGSTENLWLISFTVSSPSRRASRMDIRRGCASALKNSALKLLSCCRIPVSRLSCGIGSRLGEDNFRFARQPPTIVTWAELHFYDLPLIRPSGFVNSAALMGELQASVTQRPGYWGYRRIQGALTNLGYQVGRGTVANILKEYGLEPAPERKRKTTWKEFLSQHREVIVAADFFTVEAWTREG